MVIHGPQGRKKKKYEEHVPFKTLPCISQSSPVLNQYLNLVQVSELALGEKKFHRCVPKSPVSLRHHGQSWQQIIAHFRCTSTIKPDSLRSLVTGGRRVQCI